MLEIAIVLIATCVAVAWPSASHAGPRHLEHWKPAGPAEQSEFASNSKHSKDLWANRRGIGAGTSGQTQPTATDGSQPLTDQPQPADGDPTPTEGESEPVQSSTVVNQTNPVEQGSPSESEESQLESWKGLFKRLKAVFKPVKRIREQANSPAQPAKNSKALRNGGRTSVQGDWSF